jgi:hypothetical protein
MLKRALSDANQIDHSIQPAILNPITALVEQPGDITLRANQDSNSPAGEIEPKEDLRIVKKYLEDFLRKRPSLKDLFERAIIADITLSARSDIQLKTTLRVSKSWIYHPTDSNHQATRHHLRRKRQSPQHQTHVNITMQPPLKVSKQWLYHQ